MTAKSLRSYHLETAKCRPADTMRTKYPVGSKVLIGSLSYDSFGINTGNDREIAARLSVLVVAQSERHGRSKP
jgi:hypothetical protein